MTDEEIRKISRELIANPAKWPMFPILPLKRWRGEMMQDGYLGVIIHPRILTVVPLRVDEVWSRAHSLTTANRDATVDDLLELCPTVRFLSVEALLQTYRVD